MAGRATSAPESSLSTPRLVVSPWIVLLVVAMGFFMILPQAGAASGFINTIRQVGGIMGSAVVGAVLQHQLASEMSGEATHRASQIVQR